MARPRTSAATTTTTPSIRRSHRSSARARTRVRPGATCRRVSARIERQCHRDRSGQPELDLPGNEPEPRDLALPLDRRRSLVGAGGFRIAGAGGGHEPRSRCGGFADAVREHGPRRLLDARCRASWQSLTQSMNGLPVGSLTLDPVAAGARARVLRAGNSAGTFKLEIGAGALDVAASAGRSRVLSWMRTASPSARWRTREGNRARRRRAPPSAGSRPRSPTGPTDSRGSYGSPATAARRSRSRAPPAARPCCPSPP